MKDNNVSILINNVEKFDPYGKHVHRATDEEIIEIFNANVYPMTFMTRIIGE